mgnify:CR=1 FL=1
MQNYKVGNEVHVLDSEEFENMLPNGAVKITQAQADILAAPKPETPSEANSRKDAQVTMEVTPPLVATVNGIGPASAGTSIAQAKAARKAEL